MGGEFDNNSEQSLNVEQIYYVSNAVPNAFQRLLLIFKVLLVSVIFCKLRKGPLV